MTEEYKIIEARQPRFFLRKLLKVPHNGETLIVSYPAFGPNTYEGNIKEMQKSYSHPQTGKRISFREPTTSESISAAAYTFENFAKPNIFDLRWFWVGRIARTSEGVFVNPPRDAQGNLIIDEKTLKFYLNNAEKVNGIWLLHEGCVKDFGFAPYETFIRGVQDCGDFSQGGLARVLEHTTGREAKNLRTISSSRFYEGGVSIWGFSKIKKPVLELVSLGSDRYLDGSGLDVNSGNDSDDGWGDGGCAFGVLN